MAKDDPIVEKEWTEPSAIVESEWTDPSESKKKVQSISSQRENIESNLPSDSAISESIPSSSDFTQKDNTHLSKDDPDKIEALKDRSKQLVLDMAKKSLDTNDKFNPAINPNAESNRTAYIDALVKSGNDRVELNKISQGVTDQKQAEIRQSKYGALTPAIDFAERMYKTPIIPGLKGTSMQDAEHIVENVYKGVETGVEGLEEGAKEFAKASESGDIDKLIHASIKVPSEALNTGFALASIVNPALRAFTVTSDAIKEVANKNLPAHEADFINKAIDAPMQSATMLSEKLGFNPEKHQNWAMIIQAANLVPLILGGKAYEMAINDKAGLVKDKTKAVLQGIVDFNPVKNIKDLHSLSAKAAKGEATTQEKYFLQNIADQTKDLTVNDFIGAAKQTGNNDLAVTLEKHNEPTGEHPLSPEVIKTQTEIDNLKKATSEALPFLQSTIETKEKEVAQHLENNATIIDDEGHLSSDRNENQKEIDFLKEQIKANEHLGEGVVKIFKDRLNELQPKVTESETKLIEPKEDVIMIHHGEDTRDAAKEVGGTDGTNLIKEGADDIAKTAENLKDVNKIYASPVERTQQSADIIKNKTGIPIETNEGLGAWEIGDYDGMPREQFEKAQKYYVDNENAITLPEKGSKESIDNDLEDVERHPLEESFKRFRERVVKTHNNIVDKGEKGVGILTHSKNIKVVEALRKHGEWNEAAKKEFTNPENKIKSAEVREINKKELNPNKYNTDEIIPKTETENAIQKQKTGSVLQRQPEGIGKTGSEREGMESGEQGIETPKTSEKEVKETSDITEGGHIEPPDKTFSVKNKKAEEKQEKHGIKEAVAEATKLAKKNFGDTWDAAKEKIDNKRINLAEFRKKLADEPIDSGVSLDETNALLLHDQIDLETKLDKVIESINSGDIDENTMNNLQSEKAQLKADLFDNYVASKKVGTEQGRGLASRKMLSNREYSLVNMESEFRAEQNGKPLTPEQEKFVAERYKAIREKSEAWDEFEKDKEAIFIKFREKVEKEFEQKYGRQTNDIKTRGKKIADNIRKLKTKSAFLTDDKGAVILDKNGNKIDLSQNSFYNDAIEVVATSVEMGAEIADAIQKGIEHLKANINYKNLDDVNKKKLEESFARQITNVHDLKEASRLSAQKKRYETLKNKYISRRLHEDYATPERKRLILDEEAIRLRAELQKEKDLFNIAKDNARLQNLGWTEKGMSKFNKLIREGLLSSPKTLLKLLSFDMWRSLVIRPLYNIMTLPLNLIPKVAKISGKAPIEGSLNAKELLKGEKAFIEKNTYVQMLNKLKKGGKSDLDLAFGNHNLELPMFATRTHGAIKQLGFNVEYNYAKASLDKWAKKTGIADDPATREFIGRYAYAKAMDAIYMSDSRILKQYQLNLRLLENSKMGNTGKIAAFGARFLFPILKVPYNYGKDVMIKQTPIGLTNAAIKAFKADVSKLTPEQADAIILGLKKGAVGTTVMALGGFVLANQLGGLYDKDKERKTGLAEGESKIGDLIIPAWANHNVLMGAAQSGAEIAYLFEHAPRGYGDARKIFNAAIETGAKNAQNLPFYGEIVRDVEAIKSEKGAYRLVADEVGKSIPALIQWIAQQTDTEEGKGLHPFAKPRKVNVRAKDPLEMMGNVLQSKVPYLRNQLPTRIK